ncbi:hypothetical protein SAMN05216326_12552 [Nitrosomonas marina]|uniref:Phage terminase small subunit n=1 Tax=Nitrosomonas marina TaxID=917 RepID=A0A1I0E7Q4_9PROT|nr:hypothetical protein [Nitrosomonas marina]SET41116.1 hypothetical protein SAMN05216326_12552 [Nitrosomonas marina]
MAAKPKLTPEQWAEVRKTWESDSRKGFPWLVKELGLGVSVEAVRQRSKSEGWEKAKKPSLENKKPSLRNEKTKLGKTAKNKPKTKTSKTVTADTGPITKALIKSGETGAKANKGGRPTKYRDEYAEQAYKLCLLGYTDKELADFFGVAESTINEWKVDHREFSESISNGKVRADAVAAERLFVRVCGYRYTETKTKVGFTEDGDEFSIERTVTEKEVPPDVNAAFLWLKNRQASRWRDRVDNSIKLDGETLRGIADKFTEIMEKARERQKAVLIERGILIDSETGRPVDG